MAAVGRRLRNELKEFEVYALQKTGRVLGTGSYGTVIEMKMNNESVAVKKIHEFLLGDSDSGITKALEQFEEECKRWVTSILIRSFVPVVSLPSLFVFSCCCFYQKECILLTNDFCYLLLVGTADQSIYC